MAPRRSNRLLEREPPSPAPAQTPAITPTHTVALTAASTKVTAKVTAVAEKRKRKRPASDNDESKSRTYGPPERYAHLNGVPDAIDYSLILLLVGLNPGVTTATVGHAYSNKTNRFWRYLHSSGLTPDRLIPSLEDQTLPAKYSLGLTNLVARPTNEQAELSKKEMEDSVPILEDKIKKFKPEAVCIVGKGIWDSIYREKHGKKLPAKGFEYGWQEEEWLGVIEAGGEEQAWGGASVFVSPSTSGLVTIDQTAMAGMWKKLGDWVNEKRNERVAKVPGDSVNWP